MDGYDAISANITAIPVDGTFTGHIFAYVSGTLDIVWTQEEINRFPHASFDLIDQGGSTPWRAPTIMDIENGAFTAADIPEMERQYPGIKVYCNQSTIPSVYAEGYRGQLWVAAPGTDAQLLAANIEREYPGLVVFAVQDQWFASYDHSTMFAPVEAPVIDHINVEGYQLARPDHNTVPAVVQWYGVNGVATRQTNIPRSLWDQITWSK